MRTQGVGNERTPFAREEDSFLTGGVLSLVKGWPFEGTVEILIFACGMLWFWYKMEEKETGGSA